MKSDAKNFVPEIPEETRKSICKAIEAVNINIPDMSRTVEDALAAIQQSLEAHREKCSEIGKNIASIKVPDFSAFNAQIKEALARDRAALAAQTAKAEN